MPCKPRNLTLTLKTFRITVSADNGEAVTVDVKVIVLTFQGTCVDAGGQERAYGPQR